MQFAWKIGVLMLVALAILVLPGGGGALNVVLAALTIAFLAAIAIVGYRLYRQYQLDIDSLEPNVRLVLYSSVGGAVLTSWRPTGWSTTGSGSWCGSRCWRSARTGCTGSG